MDHRIVAKLTAENLHRAIGDYFIGVHVEADAEPRPEIRRRRIRRSISFLYSSAAWMMASARLLSSKRMRLVGLRRSLFHHAEGAD
jgi:hypothetical protein